LHTNHQIARCKNQTKENLERKLDPAVLNPKKAREEAGSIHKDEEPEAQALYVLDSSAAAQLPSKRDND